jgi:hypothetical protein
VIGVDAGTLEPELVEQGRDGQEPAFTWSVAGPSLAAPSSVTGRSASASIRVPAAPPSPAALLDPAEPAFPDPPVLPE